MKAYNILFQHETAKESELIYTRRLKPLAQLLLYRFQSKLHHYIDTNPHGN